MLAQTTFFIALLTTIALGVLSTNLISAGIVHQHQLTKYSTMATDDAVDNFTLLIQTYVQRHGTQGPWPANIPASAPMALCPPQNGNTACPYTYTTSAEITGASSPLGTLAQPGIAPIANDRAMNLQKFLIDEERISATVTATMSDANGVVATGTRYLTLRVFNGSPYVMISGQRSIEAVNGMNAAIEGDNGGVEDSNSSSITSKNVPQASKPDAYHDTKIYATMNCNTVDAIVGASGSHPSHNQGRGNRGLVWGVGTGGGYELPCTDSFATAAPGAFGSKNWTNGNVPGAGSR